MNNIIELKNGKKFFLNKETLKKQKVSIKNILLLKKEYIKKFMIFEKMKATDNKKDLIELNKKVLKLEFKIQKLWNFPKDANFHRWFDVPKCSCPKSDNYLALGTKFRHINKNCPIHGSD